MGFNELLEIAKATLNERRLSRLSTAGTVAAAFLTDRGMFTQVSALMCLREWDFARNMPPQRQ